MLNLIMITFKILDAKLYSSDTILLFHDFGLVRYDSLNISCCTIKK